MVTSVGVGPAETVDEVEDEVSDVVELVEVGDVVESVEVGDVVESIEVPVEEELLLLGPVVVEPSPVEVAEEEEEVVEEGSRVVEMTPSWTAEAEGGRTPSK